MPRVRPGFLGRVVPPDWEHVRRYALSAVPLPAKPTPVVLGVNWYEAFDYPEKHGKDWWIGRANGGLGRLRGGHAICVKPDALDDFLTWRRFYDQGETGACVGYSSSRMMSLLNRARYDAPWLWERARLRDGDPGNDDLEDREQGTTVRAGLDVLRRTGHCRIVHGRARKPEKREGVSAYRWAGSVDEVLAVLRSPSSERRDAVALLNSWGTAYPHVVWLPLGVLDRLLREDGEAGLVTDR